MINLYLTLSPTEGVPNIEIPETASCASAPYPVNTPITFMPKERRLRLAFSYSSFAFGPTPIQYDQETTSFEE